VETLVHAINQCVKMGLPIQLKIVGEGNEYTKLVDLANELGISGYVEFCGAMPHEEALKFFQWAHCLVLPSLHSEGWPKVVAEAMCYGVIPIATSHGHIPAMLEGRGILLENGSAEEIANSLSDVINRLDFYKEIAREATNWAKRYSLDRLSRDLKKIIETCWCVNLRDVENG
jgi:glycosyltransferase involved in cell wall biosynthesis